MADGRMQAFGPKDEVLKKVLQPGPTPDAATRMAPARPAYPGAASAAGLALVKDAEGSGS